MGKDQTQNLLWKKKVRFAAIAMRVFDIDVEGAFTQKKGAFCKHGGVVQVLPASKGCLLQIRIVSIN